MTISPTAVPGRSPRLSAPSENVRPETDVEVLTSDLKGDVASLQLIIDARPDVLNHNVETVARLQRAVRPSAGYLRSLTVLARSVRAGLTTKSGLMVGLGEDADEVEEVLADLAAVGVSIATIGQYLVRRPNTCRSLDGGNRRSSRTSPNAVVASDSGTSNRRR